MVSSEDEDDKFLYGSDEEPGNAVQNKRKRNVQAALRTGEPDTKRVKIPAEQPAADILVERANSKERKQEEGNPGEGGPLPTQETQEAQADQDEADQDEDEDLEDEVSDYSESESEQSESVSDSDSDVEIIIGTGTDSSKLDSKNLATPSTAATITSASESTIEPVSERSVTTTATVAAVVNDTSAAVGKAVGALDLNAVGEYEGQPITDVDPEVLKEKPWRQPGANISDYFNYGFTEDTWMEYLHKQEKLRKEYNPRKILMGLLSLQQQGKLTDGTSSGDGAMSGNGGNCNVGGVSSHGDMKSPNKNNTSVNPMPPPPAFPMGIPPMFGGFPPFPFPGMMPPHLNPASNTNGGGQSAGNKNGNSSNNNGNNNNINNNNNGGNNNNAATTTNNLSSTSNNNNGK
ncbi:cleavage polyadenylation factor subunit FIP1 Ecym_7155 [Eremothecium cymbalariae DBVPG|uniref:Pre-mRNA polyadenylation factor FIP1 n=1 Tax=Eremothecium cymbalariae (strain CBS 270.75 / DBVPG 7215 / KCTC 17166 / NRRL Y-17582) TaxID=931890 RepID=G8JVY8_ERECY|nr:hypothetical protein Ecym_7155 [Eremothecium cymbalariae DBVPG\